jgi:outer membrane protein assembly factor BamD
MRFITPFIALCSLSLFLSSCSGKFGKVLKSKDYNYKLQVADEYYAKKNYRDAQTLYEELYPVFKGTDKFEELYYKDAYCFYYMKDYLDAENFFKGFLEVFPNSSKAEEVDYMHAYTVYKRAPKVELDQTNTLKAIGMMQTFINTHPGSDRNKEANAIIDECRAKLELKEFNASELYYKMGQFRASAIGYEALLTDFPESASCEKYNLAAVKSYYQLAQLSIPEKQVERFQKVVSEYQDFADRYPDSKLLKDAAVYRDLSQNNIKEINNEQTKTSVER